MNERHLLPARRRDRLYSAITLALGVLLLPAAFLRHPGRARELACAWALRLRFPAEDLTGLSPGTRAALTAARTAAFWRDHQLIGVTSGHRDAVTQQRLFLAEVRRSGSPDPPAPGCCHPRNPDTSTASRWTCGPSRAHAGWNGTAPATASTASTPTNGGTSNTGRTPAAHRRCCPIPARSPGPPPAATPATIATGGNLSFEVKYRAKRDVDLHESVQFLADRAYAWDGGRGTAGLLALSGPDRVSQHGPFRFRWE